MALKPPPKLISNFEKDKALRQFITGGGAPADEPKEESDKPNRKDWVTLSLRLPPELIKKIDAKRKNHGWISRNAYIYRAIEIEVEKE